ncbi:MAG: helix-turn-helix transcriptional regulator [Dehalococcoidia bacterium]
MDHAGNLIRQARLARRPKWSQQFLADELTERGYGTTRSQIARLERGDAVHAGSAELLTAAAIVLEVDVETFQNAVIADYLDIASSLAPRLLPVERLLSLHDLGIPPGARRRPLAPEHRSA